MNAAIPHTHRYIHAKNIAHRDLKLENFIMTSKDPSAGIKLIDFGTVRVF
jgi:serine/threonine protein kinase